MDAWIIRFPGEGPALQGLVGSIECRVKLITLHPSGRGVTLQGVAGTEYSPYCERLQHRSSALRPLPKGVPCHEPGETR